MNEGKITDKGMSLSGIAHDLERQILSSVRKLRSEFVNGGYRIDGEMSELFELDRQLETLEGNMRPSDCPTLSPEEMRD